MCRGRTWVDCVFRWAGALITQWKMVVVFGPTSVRNFKLHFSWHPAHYPFFSTENFISAHGHSGHFGETICSKPVFKVWFGIKAISMPMWEFDTKWIFPTINIGKMNHNKLTPHAPWYRLHAPFNPCIQLLCENHKSTSPSNSNPRKVGGRREAPTPVNMVSLWIVFVIRKTVNRGLTGKLNWYF